jgi:type II secretory pathway component PulJ
MIRDTAGESALDVAVKRLERAVALLEQDLSRMTACAGAEAGHASDQDRARLASELDQARARERDLEEAGAQASAALGRAIAEIKSVLNGHAPAPSPEA